MWKVKKMKDKPAMVMELLVLFQKFFICQHLLYWRFKCCRQAFW